MHTNMTALVLKITQFCRFLYTSTMEPGRLSDLVLEGSSRAGARVCQGATFGQGRCRISMNFYEFLWISINFYEFLWISMDFYGFLWISMKSRESIGKSESDLPLNQLLSNLLFFLLVRFWRFVHMSERRKVVGVVQVWYPWSWHLGHSGDACISLQSHLLPVLILLFVLKWLVVSESADSESASRKPRVAFLVVWSALSFLSQPTFSGSWNSGNN